MSIVSGKTRITPSMSEITPLPPGKGLDGTDVPGSGKSAMPCRRMH
jgi:hypothetical protein